MESTFSIQCKLKWGHVYDLSLQVDVISQDKAEKSVNILDYLSEVSAITLHVLKQFLSCVNVAVGL